MGEPVEKLMASTATREIEAKFKLGPKADLANLASAAELPQGFSAGPTRIRLIDDIYLDTEDHALLRAGFGLRLRQAGGRTRLTIKGLSRPGMLPIHQRFELESDVAEGFAPLNPLAWSPVMRRWVLAMAGEANRLLPVVNIGHARLLRTISRRPADQRQTETNGRSSEMRPVAEWTVEELRVSRPDRDGQRAGMPEWIGDFVEAELELMEGGDPKDLELLTKHWLAMPGVAPEATCKLERAMAMMAEHQPHANAAGLRPDLGMAEAGRLIVRRQLTEMLLNEGGARRGEDIEYVHDMRVACRRASGALAAFGPFFEASALRPARRLFKRTRRELGEIRDLDVALEKLSEHRRKGRKSDGAGLEALAERWQSDREAAYEHLFDWLDSRKYRRLIGEAETLAWTPGAGALPLPDAPGQPWQLRHIMPGAIVQRYAIVRSYEVALDDLEHVDASVLHQLRIDAKRLRYVLETVAPLLGDSGLQVIRRVKRLQSVLGDLNDAAVKRQRLETLADEGLDSTDLRAYEDLQVQAITELKQDLSGCWDAVRGQKMRALLGRALASL